MRRDENQPRPLHYAGPVAPGQRPPAYRPSRRFPPGLIRPIWTFTAVLIGLTVYIVPVAEQAFRRFNSELPGSTKALLTFSRLVRSNYLWIPLAALGLAAPFLIARFAAMGADDSAYRLRLRLLGALVLLLGAAVTVWVVLSLFVPYLNLIQSAAGGK